MATLSCKCFNISLSLLSSPVPTSDHAWLAEQLGTRKLGDTKFRNNGVPVIELDNLVTTRTVSGWRVWKCCNCNVDVCAIDGSDPSRGFVNLELEEHSGNGAHKVREGDSRSYSPCFRLILEEGDNTVTKGVSADLHAIESFNKLQGRVDAFIRTEEAAMEKRIRDFIKKQQDDFNAVKTRANKDRSILWRTICRLNKSYGSTESVSNAPSASATVTSKVAASAPPKIAPIAANTTNQDAPSSKVQQKAVDKGWQAGDVLKASSNFMKNSSNFNLKTSTSDGIFSFDDEDIGVDGADTIYRLPSRHQDVDSDGESESVDTFDPSKYGASLPIHIAGPSILANRTRETKAMNVTFTNPDPDERPKRQAPRESWSSKSAIGGEDVPAEMAASFALPLSLNRRIKSLI